LTKKGKVPQKKKKEGSPLTGADGLGLEKKKRGGEDHIEEKGEKAKGRKKGRPPFFLR